MRSVLGTLFKFLAFFVLAAVAVGMVLIAAGIFAWGHHQAAETAKQARKNAAVDVLKMYASPSNPTLAWRFYLVKNTSGKTITAIKFRVTVFNKLNEPIDRTIVTHTKPIVANAEVYCDICTLFDADTGLATESDSYVDRTDKRLVNFAEHEAGCKPEDMRVNYPCTVKVLAVAYAGGS
jgi:hypothetical protein